MRPWHCSKSGGLDNSCAKAKAEFHVIEDAGAAQIITRQKPCETFSKHVAKESKLETRFQLQLLTGASPRIRLKRSLRG